MGEGVLNIAFFRGSAVLGKASPAPAIAALQQLRRRCKGFSKESLSYGSLRKYGTMRR